MINSFAQVQRSYARILEESLPLTLWIENPGYATVHADAFDRGWAVVHPVG